MEPGCLFLMITLIIFLSTNSIAQKNIRNRLVIICYFSLFDSSLTINNAIITYKNQLSRDTVSISDLILLNTYLCVFIILRMNIIVGQINKSR